MRQLQLLSLFAAALLVIAGPAAAITIDDFTVADSVADLTVGSPVTGATLALGGSSVFGTRTTTVEMLTNSGAGGSTNSDIGGGAWSLGNSFFVTGRTQLTYLPVPLSTVDLLTGTEGLFRFGFIGADGLSTVTIVATSAGGAESTAIFVPGVLPASIDVLFSSFLVTGAGAADFSMITSLAIISENTVAGADSAYAPMISVPNVPEPATLTLFGGALLGLALLRKRVAK